MAGHSKQLAEADLQSLCAAIRELPTQSVSPPIERLMVVSFRDSTNWVTRSYDSLVPEASISIFPVAPEFFKGFLEHGR